MKWLAIFSITLLSACGSGDKDNLDQFVQEALAKPSGEIEPIPEFEPYHSFSYSAAGLRSPFELPLTQEEIAAVSGGGIQPDFDRPKQPLEAYDLSQLTMVGTLANQQGQLWALIRDGSGKISRVTAGEYIGRNYGRVLEVGESRVLLIEIVSNGTGGWLERPTSLGLYVAQGQEQVQVEAVN